MRQSPVGPAAQAFAGLTRAVTTDAVASNMVAEGLVYKSRAANGKRQVLEPLHLRCDAHCTALVYGKSLLPMDEACTGAVRVALPLRTGAATTRFRQALRDDLNRRLEILNGHPPPEAQEYNIKVLRLFASNGMGSGTRRALLALCPDGEWRRKFNSTRGLGAP